MAPSVIRRAFVARSTRSPRFSSHWHLLCSSCSLAPVSVAQVRSIVDNRVELVLLPRTLALAPHVLAELAAGRRALFVLNAPANRNFQLSSLQFYSNSVLIRKDGWEVNSNVFYILKFSSVLCSKSFFREFNSGTQPFVCNTYSGS